MPGSSTYPSTSAQSSRRHARHVGLIAAIAVGLVGICAAPAVASIPESSQTSRAIGPAPTATVAAGAELADRLNARYADTARACPHDSPAYFCSGVLIRMARTLTPTEGQMDRDGLAFSYLRADVGTSELWYGAAAGFSVQNWSDQINPLRFRCVFAYDGATNSRPDACGEQSSSTTPPGSSRPCAEQGIADVTSWIAHFISLEHPNYNCSFTGDTEPFQLSIDVREAFPDPEDRRYWNEVIIGAWPADEISALPIDSFFYQADPAPHGRNEAIRLQHEFFELSGRTVPVLRLTLTEPEPFEYLVEDQPTP